MSSTTKKTKITKATINFVKSLKMPAELEKAIRYYIDKQSKNIGNETQTKNKRSVKMSNTTKKQKWEDIHIYRVPHIPPESPKHKNEIFIGVGNMGWGSAEIMLSLDADFENLNKLSLVALEDIRNNFSSMLLSIEADIKEKQTTESKSINTQLEGTTE